jgi:hypothetical protein
LLRKPCETDRTQCEIAMSITAAGQAEPAASERRKVSLAARTLTKLKDGARAPLRAKKRMRGIVDMIDDPAFRKQRQDKWNGPLVVDRLAGTIAATAG